MGGSPPVRSRGGAPVEDLAGYLYYHIYIRNYVFIYSHLIIHYFAYGRVRVESIAISTFKCVCLFVCPREYLKNKL